MSGPEANRGVASNWNCPTSVPTFDALPLQAPIGFICMTEDDGLSYQFDGTAWNQFPAAATAQESFVLGLNADMTFANAGGGHHVTPQTFIRNDAPISADRVWNFETLGGIGEGWAAWLDVTLGAGGSLELQSGGDTLTTIDGAQTSRAQVLLYVDPDGWQLYGDAAADNAIVSIQDKGVAVSVAPTILRTAPPMATYAVYVELAGVDSENAVTLAFTWTDSTGAKSQSVALAANSYASGVFVIQPDGIANVSFSINVVTADLGYDYYIGIIPIDVSTP
jgi:hypothetical protein